MMGSSLCCTLPALRRPPVTLQDDLGSVAAMLGLWDGAEGGTDDTERLILFQLPSMLPTPPPPARPPAPAVKAEPGSGFLPQRGRSDSGFGGSPRAGAAPPGAASAEQLPSGKVRGSPALSRASALSAARHPQQVLNASCAFVDACLQSSRKSH